MLQVIGIIGSGVFILALLILYFIRIKNEELGYIIANISVAGAVLSILLFFGSSFAGMILFNNYHDKTEKYLLEEIQLKPVEDNFYICTDAINDEQIIEGRTADVHFYYSYYKDKLYTEKIKYKYCEVEEVSNKKPHLKKYKRRVPLSKQNSLIFKLLYFNKNNIESENTIYVFCVPKKENSVLLNYIPKQDLVETTER